MATSTPPPSSTPHRASVNGACTHLTMTRLWSDVFLCQICLQRPALGWLYRCTQDSELLIDDDLEMAGTRKLDKYCDIFERPPTPRKRSPAARMSKFSFLEETSDRDLKSYTPEQVNKILAQRAHILETAQEQELQEQGLGFLIPSTSQSSILTKLTKRTDSPSRKSSQPSAKPWLPKKECQFKCCHHCRPNLVERTFLSLDSVAKGDLPATAISGWGFQLRLGKQKRPIGLVKHAKNLGLRPSPPPRSESPFSDRILMGWSDRSRHRSTSPENLGTRSPLVTITPPNPAVDTSIITSIGTQSLQPLPSPPTNIKKDTSHSADVQEVFQRMTMGSQRQILPQIPSHNGHRNDTQENIQTQELSVSLDLATSTPLPPPGDDEIFPPTPMMQHEWDVGSFGSGPLEVKSGVAFTEEAVELNVPDLIISEDDHFWRNGS